MNFKAGSGTWRARRWTGQKETVLRFAYVRAADRRRGMYRFIHASLWAGPPLFWIGRQYRTWVLDLGRWRLGVGW